MKDFLQERYLGHISSYNLDVQCLMQGSDDAEIVLIGEFPGEQEIAYKKPFIGSGGKHLFNVIRSFGIKRNICYSTCVIKRRVTLNTKVGETEFSLWQEALLFELEALTKAKIIVCVGEFAMNAILGIEKINEHRGSVYSYNDIPVVCVNNPSLIFRQPASEIIFNLNMEKVKMLWEGTYKEHPVECHINPTFDEALEYISAIKCIHKKVAIDIETIGQETACIGLSHDPHYGMCINFRNRNEHTYTVEQEAEILLAFADMCDDPSTFTITQNGNFDTYFMGYKDHLLFKNNFDTLLAHHVLYPRMPHNLGFLVAQYTTHPFYKDDKDEFKEGGDINGFWQYNCKDAALTFAVATALEKELHEQSLYDFFTNYAMRIEKHLPLATVTGIAVDLETRKNLRSELRSTVFAYLRKFNEAVETATGLDDLDINPRSPKQLQHLFFDLLDCKSTGKSTAAPVRENWLKDPRVSLETRDTIIALNSYLEQNKFYTTYVDTQLDKDGRFRSAYKQFGVVRAPGRLSSERTLWGSGGNAQNLPHRAYNMFITDDPNTVFIYFDLSQAEARYVGWDANIEQWKTDFEQARIDKAFDAHRALASIMFNVPYDEVPKEDFLDKDGKSQKDPTCDLNTLKPTIRYTAKRCRHGLNYRMYIATLAQNLGVSFGEAARNFHIYHRTNPELAEWWKALENEIKKTKMLFNSFGRRLLITERLSPDSLDSIIAFRPQSTIGDKVKLVWAQCHEDDKWNLLKARICSNVHDALWGLSDISYAKTALSIMKKHAEKPIPITSIVTGKTEPLIIPADLKMSNLDNDQTLSMANMKDVIL